jgi:hypothetical protein
LVRHGPAASSGSNPKAPGFAGGYLLRLQRRDFFEQAGHIHRFGIEIVAPAAIAFSLSPAMAFAVRASTPLGRGDLGVAINHDTGSLSTTIRTVAKSTAATCLEKS